MNKREFLAMGGAMPLMLAGAAVTNERTAPAAVTVSAIAALAICGPVLTYMKYVYAAPANSRASSTFEPPRGRALRGR